MRRRAVLATVGAVTLAGCGWNQEQGSESGGDGGTDDDGTPDPGELAESESGDEPIEDDPEDLLLSAEAVGSEWSAKEIQRTGVCNAFEQTGELWTLSIETCAAVYDDEETAVEEYESSVETSERALAEQLDLEPEIGDEATVFRGSDRLADVFRVRFRDTNATGLVDLSVEVFPGPEGEEPEEAPDRDETDAVEWAATMHGAWRA